MMRTVTDHVTVCSLLKRITLLKQALEEYFNLRDFPTSGLAETATEQVIDAWHSVRPHASLAYITAPADLIRLTKVKAINH